MTQSHQPRTLRRLARSAGRLLLVSTCIALLASSAGAVVFTVTLSNGTTFETRDRPIVAEWDESYVMLRTDRGNWISLAKDDIADVSSAAEASGFGFQLDSTTLYVGFTPGDIALDEEAAAEGGQGGLPPAPPDDSPITYGGSTGGYGLDQFLDIPESGTITSQPLSGASGDQ